MSYAKVIIDISAESVDRAFTYSVPEELEGKLYPGAHVRVPFGRGRALREGIVIGLTDTADIDPGRIRPVESVETGRMDPDEELIRLADFMASRYGCTMNQALKTVLPVRRTVRKNSRRQDPVAVIGGTGETGEAVISELSPAQEEIFRQIISDRRVSLLYGVTGSGKTRIYIELIKKARKEHKASIVLIPEISLTYQTVRELIKYLGEGIAVMHSRLSEGERYEQYIKAVNGEIDVMVGPRSALFTPFSRLGLIIIDEEHERTYLSETAPRYDAREVAARRALMCGAKLVLGSATPSLESYLKAEEGTYALHKLKTRARAGAELPSIHVVDMRRELAEGNSSVFSRKLAGMMEERLARGEQIMLFLNRRGYAGFVSCRSCGKAMKCPHCDVTLTAHNSWYIDPQTGKRSGALLSCHYCGYSTGMPSACPVCGSKYIAPFRAGTEKLEQQVQRMFPQSRVLRLDGDTTVRKGSYERILSSFRDRKADILIGTQMIVKGHDFAGVTLVGIIAADLSLNGFDYDASERTYQLLVQASGRSGRGALAGDTVIQSYIPDHYAITCSAQMDYESFYEREISYRRLLKYPPVMCMLFFRLTGQDEALLNEAADYAARLAGEDGTDGLTVIGPCNEGIYKIKDNYRKILYIKHFSHDIITKMRDRLQAAIGERYPRGRVYVSADIR